MLSATNVALVLEGAAALDFSSVAAFDLVQVLPALDLQQGFVAVVVASLLTVVALAACAAFGQVLPAAVAVAALEQAFPPALDLQQDLVVVAVPTVVAVAVLALVQVLVGVLAAALAAACGQPCAEAVPTAAKAKRTKSKNKFFIMVELNVCNRK